MVNLELGMVKAGWARQTGLRIVPRETFWAWQTAVPESLTVPAAAVYDEMVDFSRKMVFLLSTADQIKQKVIFKRLFCAANKAV